MNKNKRGRAPIFLLEGNWKSLGLYVFLTFLWTWVFLYPALRNSSEPLRTLLIIVAAFGPFLSAMTTIGIFEGSGSLKRWLRSIFRLRIPIYYYLVGAFIIPLLIGSFQYLIFRVLGGSGFSWG